MCTLEIPENMTEADWNKAYEIYDVKKPKKNDPDVILSLAQLHIAQRKRQQELFNHSCKPADGTKKNETDADLALADLYMSQRDIHREFFNPSSQPKKKR